jgi:acetyl-CoA C-acetyltransferase
MQNKAREPVIIKGCRTPIGKFLGGLSFLSASDLGALVIKSLLEKTGVDPKDIDEVIMGNVIGTGVGQAPARQAAIRGGVPASVPALTINKVCGSGLKAVMLAAQAIRAGDANMVLAGGMESMSNAPFYLRGMRAGVKFGNQKIEDALVSDGLWCAFAHCHMGTHAEYTARKGSISRQEADEFSLRSHNLAVQAVSQGKFDNEIIPVACKNAQQDFVNDEGPRKDTSISTLEKLRPAFPDAASEYPGELTITAGNSAGLNDGAAGFVVASRGFAEAHGLEIEARITEYVASGLEPQDLFFAPVKAVNELMYKEQKNISDYGLVELNEAFAVQTLADIRGLKLDIDVVNVYGGAIALGHPIGASGARILVTLLSAMKDKDVETGLATLCLGGGNAVALSLEKL